MPYPLKSYEKRRHEQQVKRFNLRPPPRSDVQASVFRGSSQWQSIRSKQLKLSPLCCDPLGIHKKDRQVEPATECHHIEPLTVRYNLRATPSNIASLCTYCHHKIDGMNRRGSPTRHLFTKPLTMEKRFE